MGWWRETINIVKRKLAATCLAGGPFDLSGASKALAAHRVSTFCGTMVKLLARMHSQFWRLDPDWDPSRCDHCFWCLYRPWSGPRYRETAIVEKGVMLYHGVTLGDRKGCRQTPSNGTWRSLGLAHAQIIGPVEIGPKAKVGAGAVVVSRCTKWCNRCRCSCQMCGCTVKKMNQSFIKKKKNRNTTWTSWSMLRKLAIRSSSL